MFALLEAVSGYEAEPRNYAVARLRTTLDPLGTLVPRTGHVETTSPAGTVFDTWIVPTLNVSPSPETIEAAVWNGSLATFGTAISGTVVVVGATLVVLVVVSGSVVVVVLDGEVELVGVVVDTAIVVVVAAVVVVVVGAFPLATPVEGRLTPTSLWATTWNMAVLPLVREGSTRLVVPGPVCPTSSNFWPGGLAS